MKRTVKFLACILLVTASLTSVAAADVIVYLKDGGRIKGEVVSESIDTITVRNEFGDLELERVNIKRILREGSSVMPYDSSVYSFKKKTWAKFAGFGSIAGGLIATAITSDSDTQAVPIYTGIGFGAMAITFFSLDFFMYGRIPKKRRTKFSYAPKLRLRPDTLAKKHLQPNRLEERHELFYGTRF